MSAQTSQKLDRIRHYLEDKGFSGLVLMRKDNFAWITSGGTSQVIIPSEQGAAAVVITADKVFLLALAVDARRILNEEMAHLPCELVTLHWYQESILDRALQLAGHHPAADVPCEAAQVNEDIYDLHYPLLDEDLERLEAVGELCDEVLTKVAHSITPDTLETEAAALLLCAFTKKGATCDVLFVGGEDRVQAYRHPNPKPLPIGKHVLLTPSVRFQGVHCNLARAVYFGDSLPPALMDAQEAVLEASATCTAMCEEGTSYKDIFHALRDVLNKRGYKDHWRQHYPGGRTGYMVCQPHFSLIENRRIGEREAYEWFVTLPGAKAAELIIKDRNKVYTASAKGHWPTRFVQVLGKKIELPNILMR